MHARVQSAAGDGKDSLSGMHCLRSLESRPTRSMITDSSLLAFCVEPGVPLGGCAGSTEL
ncbi:hypothetical protein TWF694_010582 [Orbilia ellipsospora]|uniref:Uncharacterized protein n=1 Tax=Orbilia ellipsospora TaxID=2528407 RepID=A0AAV9XAB3_9PEZI